MHFSKYLICLALASAALAQKPIGKMHSGDATVRGAVQLTGTSATIMSGAQIDAAQRSATVKLERGGELVICPESGVTLTSSASGGDQLIGVSRGSVEAHYALTASSDTIMTPDFRLQLKGPGWFHLGIGVGLNGDACVQSLAGSTASVAVNELFGEDVFEVKPGEYWLFTNGTVSGAQRNPQRTCGCPARLEVQVAAAVPPPTELGFPEQQSRRAAEAIAIGEPVPEPPPVTGIPQTSAPGEIKMQIDAPMVFRAVEAGPPLPALVARINLRPAAFPEMAYPKVQPPPKPQKRNWFQRFGSAIARMFSTRNS